MIYAICILIGCLSAFVGSLIGLGGGMILIPILLFLYQYTDSFSWATPQTIVGISLLTMVFTALSSTISYWRNGRVDYKTGTLFLIGSLPGSVLGSWLNQFIAPDKFSLYYGFVMILISLFLFLDRGKNRDLSLQSHKKANRTFQIGDETYYYYVPVVPAILISFGVGMLAGTFGIGGGAIMVPVMILLFRFPVHIAVATSMFMIFFISLFSSVTHITLGHIAWSYIVFFIGGAFIGGLLGAKTNRMLAGNTLKWVLRITLIAVSIRLIVDGLT